MIGPIIALIAIITVVCTIILHVVFHKEESTEQHIKHKDPLHIVDGRLMNISQYSEHKENELTKEEKL